MLKVKNDFLFFYQEHPRLISSSQVGQKFVFHFNDCIYDTANTKSIYNSLETILL